MRRVIVTKEQKHGDNIVPGIYQGILILVIRQDKKRRGQVIYLQIMSRIDEKLEFKSDNSITMTNNIPDPIATRELLLPEKKKENAPGD